MDKLNDSIEAEEKRNPPARDRRSGTPSRRRGHKDIKLEFLLATPGNLELSRRRSGRTGTGSTWFGSTESRERVRTETSEFRFVHGHFRAVKLPFDVVRYGEHFDYQKVFFRNGRKRTELVYAEKKVLLIL